jgi:mRNA-degrading endonuclease RelE of RelBE toxin-antitoxin system
MREKEQRVFEVRLRSNRVQRELDSLQKTDYERVISKLRALSIDQRPKGCEKLIDHIYLIRVGDIRIIYFIDEPVKHIEIGAIRRRTERTYREIQDLFR